MNTEQTSNEVTSITDTIDQYKDKLVLLEGNTPESTQCMTVSELSRWLSLLEAVDLTGKKCDEFGYSRSNNSWIKPIAFQKYIDERFHSMMFNIISDIQDGTLQAF